MVCIICLRDFECFSALYDDQTQVGDTTSQSALGRIREFDVLCASV